MTRTRLPARLPRALALVLIALGCVLLAPSPAYACDQPTVGFKKQLRQAELVFDGKVTQSLESTDRIVYVVNVRRVYEGEATTETTVTTPLSNDDCGLRGIRDGEQYVFVANQTDTGVVRAFSHEGTRRSIPNVLDTVTQVLGDGSDPVPPSALEPLPEPDPELTRVSDSAPPSLGRAAMPGLVLAGVGLLVLLAARLLGRHRS